MAREKLTITDVPEPRTIGDKNIPLQEFYADGKKYSVFSKSLFPYIKLNTEIDVEVEVKEGENYTNRKVTDIFVNGQSVKSQGQGGGYRGKSPEELDLSAKSYSMAYSKDLVVGDKVEIADMFNMADKIYQWLKVNPTATAVKETPEEKPATELEVEPITAEQKEGLKELQEGKPGQIKELIEEWGWNVKAISKLTKDQATRLIQEMEKELKDAKND